MLIFARIMLIYVRLMMIFARPRVRPRRLAQLPDRLLGRRRGDVPPLQPRAPDARPGAGVLRGEGRRAGGGH